MNDTRPIHEIADLIEAVHVYNRRLELEALTLPKAVRLTPAEWKQLCEEWKVPQHAKHTPTKLLGIPVKLVLTQEDIDRLGRFEE